MECALALGRVGGEGGPPLDESNLAECPFFVRPNKEQQMFNCHHSGAHPPKSNAGIPDMHAPVIMPNTRGCSQNAGWKEGERNKEGQMAPEKRESIRELGNNGEWPTFRSIHPSRVFRILQTA
ncbi:hypothetical protein CDAR_487151 [Caerostris darwini]|uniref:Prolactin receptor n=1 Tax=Caerostris darwini TaxID=1538125 RepID=A0AAV4TZ30_9ARAC|nr:hypothetical protein CDAR_487151 [Caerostris darwini]